MPKWPLNGLEIDFTQSQIQVNSMNSSLTGAKGSSNGYYDENDDLLFHIIDTKLYAPDGTEVGDLYTDEDNTADEMGSEIIVIPAEPEDNCLYYVIYTIQQHNDDNSHIWKVCYNLVCWHGPTIVDSGVLCSMSGECHGAIAVSDFVTDNGDTYHRLEAVGSGILTNHGQFQYINGELRLMVQTVLPNTYGYDFCELEMSKDGKVLAAAHLNVDQDNNYSIDPYNITIWILDDDLLPSVVYNADIGTPNSQTEQFTGVEIYQDPNNPDDKYIYFNKYGGVKYMIPVFGTSIWPFDPFEFSVSPLYSSSHLELARDGNIYSTNGGQNLYLVDPYDANNNTVKVIGTHNPVRNDYIESSHANAPLVFALPDQVDQANYYAYTTGTEFDCCQASYESLIKTSMAGVSFDANGNITISGSNVYWTQSSNPFTSGSQTITDIYLKGDLVIDPGAKLTVDGLKLHFKESETLDMSFNSGGVGSRLVLNNSTLTVFDECDEDIMCGGISCSGDWSYVPQGSTSTSPQPYTYMSNSTIEFAEKGIEANNGGIVKAYNSSFKDNIIDVSFVSYSYQGVDNISLFSTCEFYTTSDLYNKGYTPSYHAHIWTAPGLEFYGCSFRNEYASSVAVSQRGGGILSTSSSIIVKEKCSGFVQLGYPCPDQYTTRGEFEDLYYAIKASSGSFMTLSRQDFIDCPKGAWLIDCDAIKVTECDFDVSSETLSGSYLYDSYGLYVESSTGYHIEGNEFHDGVLGLVVYDSGIDENLIYKNTFYNLSGNCNATGLVAIGENGALTSKLFPQISGLQMRCNTFNDVDYSMAVLG
ncbi:MAG: hypothetical protein C0596_09535 [Marinilabiliales bacterium]|nr:MAG: hypothetical protein C0596_09535 [Marinilabiliales bacterium]